MARIYDMIDALKGVDDVRTKRYIAPKRVVYTQGDVVGAEKLLEDCNIQPVFHSENDLLMKNRSGEKKAGVLIDFGVEFSGSLRVLVRWVKSAERNKATLRIRLGESVTEALTPYGERNTTNDHANRDMIMTVSGLSANETNESGYRFAYIELQDENATVAFYGMKGCFYFRDIEYKGYFECSDPLLNKIWQTAAYTVHLNMQQYLWDGIKRDRLVWIGDMHTEVQTILAAFGNHEIIRESLDLTKNDTPVELWMNDIPTYSLWWLMMQHDLLRQVGDIGYLEEQRDYMVGLVKRVLPLVDENGSECLPQRRFLDWPNHENKEGEHAGLHGLLKITLERCADMMAVLDEHELSEECARAAAKMRHHVPDPNGSKQGACMLALSGIVDPKEINERLLSPGGAHGYSTFFGYYILEAKALAGDFVGALNDIREYWGAMLDLGATTFWEDFNLDWMENSAPIDEIVPEGKRDVHGDGGNYCYKQLRHSLCHGWSSGPCPYMSHYVLGIRALNATTYEIDPELGDLEWARGAYPTEWGPIEVYARKTPEGTLIEVSAPDEIRITKK